MRKRKLFPFSTTALASPLSKKKALRSRYLWKVGVFNPDITTTKVIPVTSYTTDDYNKHLCTQLFPELAKYYKQRFSLFSRYNFGIILDREGWYSVTPEEIARRQADRYRDTDVIVDFCCGCGGNSIQFANVSRVVYAVDLDPVRLRLTRHNAKIYGVFDKIHCIQADWRVLVTESRWADVVFMSPPWGGVDYREDGEYDLDSLFNGITFSQLLSLLSMVAPKVSLFLPRNCAHQFIIDSAREAGALDLEIENNKVKQFNKGISIYLTFK